MRGTKNLFAVGQDISVDDVWATLEPVAADRYRLLKVDNQSRSVNRKLKADTRLLIML
ncbi:hypothetical protein P5W92_06735 [Streptomyces sp. J15]|uniref:Uncharacterized protein n=1 Tax=Streptomyces pakalii TaxID=3036494 RepID=A0ABT7D6G8_9ACTN|nr:hypothetical protein [Streptomyces pakalii]